MVQALGCDIAQGFLFARPMPGEEIWFWDKDRQRAAAPDWNPRLSLFFQQKTRMPAGVGWACPRLENDSRVTCILDADRGFAIYSFASQHGPNFGRRVAHTATIR